MGLRRSKDVTERDAFGNPIEEPRPTSQPLTGGDPLRAGVGTVPRAAPPAPSATVEGTVPAPTGGTVPLPPTPALTADAWGTVPPAPAPPPRRSRRRLLGGLGGLFGLLLFLGPFLVGGWFAYKTIHDTVDHTTGVLRSLDDRTPATTTATPTTKAAPPRGLGARSLLAPTAVNALLRKVHADPGGKLLLLRLAPERADLQLARPGGGLNIVQLRFDGGRTLVRTPAGGTGSKSIIFSTIDRHAPARLVREAAHRLGRKTSSIDYLVLINILGKPAWSAYFTGGAAFQGDAHGHVTRRIQ